MRLALVKHLMSNTRFKPFKFLCGQEAKNRIVLAPLTNMQSPTTKLSADEFGWLRRRIEGGFSIVTTCATHVAEDAQAWPGEMGVFSDDHIPGLKLLSNAGEQANSHVIPQLFHGGFRSPSSLNGKQPVSASEFVIDAPDFEKPRALSEDEILEIKKAFVSAAVRSVRAGLPGVEVHGANGYLFTQFLSPHTNLRQDSWGGSLEKRARFLLETVREIRAAIGSSKILGMRLSPENTKLINSIDIDEMKTVCEWLVEAGVDYISLSLWDARKPSDKYPNQGVVETIRSSVSSDVALIVSGKLWTNDDVERALSRGADFVALGASAIANPDWPQQSSNLNFSPTRLPLSPEELLARGASQSFIEYLRRWNFVEGT